MPESEGELKFRPDGATAYVDKLALAMLSDSAFLFKTMINHLHVCTPGSPDSAPKQEPPCIIPGLNPSQQGMMIYITEKHGAYFRLHPP